MGVENGTVAQRIRPHHIVWECFGKCDDRPREHWNEPEIEILQYSVRLYI